MSEHASFTVLFLVTSLAVCATDIDSSVKSNSSSISKNSYEFSFTLTFSSISKAVSIFLTFLVLVSPQPAALSQPAPSLVAPHPPALSQSVPSLVGFTFLSVFSSSSFLSFFLFPGGVNLSFTESTNLLLVITFFSSTVSKSSIISIESSSKLSAHVSYSMSNDSLTDFLPFFNSVNLFFNSLSHILLFLICLRNMKLGEC